MLPGLLFALLVAAHPYQAEGEQLYDAQQYEKAVRRLSMAAEVPELSRSDRRRVYELLARSHLALGQQQKAEDDWSTLLASDATAPEPEGAPKLKESFRQAKQRLYPKDYVKLRAVPAAPDRVAVEVIDPWQQVSTVTLRDADGSRRELIGPTERKEVALPPTLSRYVVTARAADGSELAKFEGTQLVPEAVTVSTSAPATQRSRWPIWVAGAATVVVAATALALVLLAQNDSRLAGESRFASDRFALDTSARNKAIAGDVLFGVAAVGAAGTAIMVWRW